MSDVDGSYDKTIFLLYYYLKNEIAMERANIWFEWTDQQATYLKPN